MLIDRGNLAAKLDDFMEYPYVRQHAIEETNNGN